jgi:hypothetical protein
MKAFKKMLLSTPKLRGFKTLTNKPSEVYLSDLETHFSAGDVVTVEALREKNIIGSYFASGGQSEEEGCCEAEGQAADRSGG